jgi:hypothetical protein
MEDKSESAARGVAVVSVTTLTLVASVFAGALVPSLHDNIRIFGAGIATMAVNWRSIAGVKPIEHLEPLRPDLVDDLKPDLKRMERGVTLLTGLFGERLTARLVDEKGAILHEWPVDFFALKKGKLYPFEALIHGDHLYANGDLLLNLDQRGIYRVSACGAVVWRNEGGSHHSIDIDDEGFIWTPTAAAEYRDARLFPEHFAPYFWKANPKL